uniref:uncharacterized protein LOC120346950 isoform X1 n=1 Tax=Styela clava TaxID=7725 RepID=UPI0019396C9E|nr:uncharacterized protein LOC120346950 isoform X1 [Styela clava]
MHFCNTPKKMPHGNEGDHAASNKLQVKKIFVGSNSIQIPPLKTTGRAQQEYLDISLDDEPSPSPCSSTTLSFFSTTSDEFFVATPEPTIISLQPQRESVRHPVRKVYHHPPVRMKICKPTEQDFVGSSTLIVTDSQADSNKHISTLGSVVIGYHDKPGNADFVSHDEFSKSNVNDDVRISSLTGPKLKADQSGKQQQFELNSSDPTNVMENRNSNHAVKVQPTVVMRRSNLKKRGPSSRLIMRHIPNESDFVSPAEQRSRPPPPDFVNSDFDKVKNKPISSRQPDLDVMLSGAVRSSTFKKSDFIPAAAIPKDALNRAKSKSLSDLSKRENKMKRFWDRKKVVQMNTEDKERCSHTEITPSSMMTLAMELLVSKDNKAGKMFSEARRRADAASGESDSILPQLWVIPKSNQKEAIEKTASHLQPVLKSPSPTPDFDIKTSFANKPTALNPEHYVKYDQQRTIESNYTHVPSHIASQHKTVKKGYNDSQSIRERTRSAECYPRQRIPSEDVKKDLMTLTVADLVGSPDTVYTDTESEFDDKDCQVLHSPQKKSSTARFSNEEQKRVNKNTIVREPIFEENILSSNDTPSATQCSHSFPPELSLNAPPLAGKAKSQQLYRGVEKVLETPPNQYMSSAISQQDNKKAQRDSSDIVLPRTMTFNQANNNNNGILSVQADYFSNKVMKLDNVGNVAFNEKDKGCTSNKPLKISENDEVITPSSLKHVVSKDDETIDDENAEIRQPRSSRSSSISNSSSLTTVSSLALSSSSSLGNAEPDLKDSTQCKREPIVSFADYDIETNKADNCDKFHTHMTQNGQSVMQSKTSKQLSKENENPNCEFIQEVSTTASPAQMGAVPMPPPRSNSHVAMVKLRRKKFMEEAKTQQVRSDLPDSQMRKNEQHVLSKSSKLSKTTDTCTEENWLFPGIQNSRVGSRPVEERKLRLPLVDTNTNSFEPQTSKDCGVSNKQNVVRQQSSLLTSGDSSSVCCDVDEKPHCSYQVDTLGKAGTRASLLSEIIPNGYCVKAKDKSKKHSDDDEKQIPIHQCYRQLDSCLALDKTAYAGCGKNEDIDDMTERTFRNGEISVVDGFKVFLAHPHKLREDFQARNNEPTNSNWFISDFVTSSKNHDLNSKLDLEPTEAVEENIVLPTAAATLSSQQEIAPVNSTSLEQSITNIDTEFLRQSDPDSTISTKNTITESLPPGIVRSTDTDFCFPVYESVPPSESTQNKNKMSLSYNACPKPYSRSTSHHIYKPVKSSNLTSQRTISLHDINRSESPAQYGNIQTCFTRSQPQIAAEETTSQPSVKKLEEESINNEHPDFVESDGSHTNSRSPSHQYTIPSTKNSAIKLLTGGMNVYSSCVKITLNPNESEENVREDEAEEVNAPPSVLIGASRKGNIEDEKAQNVHNPTRRKSFPMKNERVRNEKNVREVIAPEMKDKLTDKPAIPPKPSLPVHSAVDEGDDFAGVVDGPTKNVKEIRAMFKGPDYANYAKPRLPLKKTAITHSVAEPGDPGEDNSKSPQTRSKSPNGEQTQVAQQILGLFKGALTLESDVTDGQPETEQEHTTPTQNGHTHTDEPQISLKDKVASFNVGKSPVKEIEDNNNNDVKDDVIKQNPEQKSAESSQKSPEIITNSAPITNGHKKTGVTQEKVNAESYDESLDQFYDVLEELTSS